MFRKIKDLSTALMFPIIIAIIAVLLMVWYVSLDPADQPQEESLVGVGVDLGATYDGLDPSSPWPSEVVTLNRDNYGDSF